MKILITGCTGRQVKPINEATTGRGVDRINDTQIIAESLLALEHQVDKRAISFGEDLSQYDLVIVGIGQLGSMNYASMVFDALWAVHSAKRLLVFHEDWKIDGTIKSFTKVESVLDIEKMKDKKYEDGKLFYPTLGNPAFDSQIALNAMQRIVKGDYDALVPAFDWGSKDIIRDTLKCKNIYNIDLTPYVLEAYEINPHGSNKSLFDFEEPKKKDYMLATLGDHRPWVKRQKLGWDVQYFGTAKFAKKLQSERDVFEECKRHWAILAPEYPHAGSGWFRIRYVYTALADSIIIAADKDIEALGIEKKNVEDLTVTELKAYAAEQKAAILKFVPLKEDVVNRMKEIVKTFEEIETLSTSLI